MFRLVTNADTADTDGAKDNKWRITTDRNAWTHLTMNKRIKHLGRATLDHFLPQVL